MGSFQLGLAVVFAVLGWFAARSLEKKYGARAWGLPHWAWAGICGLSLLIGAILLYVAERQLKKAPVPQLGYGLVPAAQVPPQQAWTPAPEQHASTPSPQPAVVPAAAIPPQVPAGWHPDPSGRFQHRWWDGTAWTSAVATNGVQGTDVVHS